MGKEKKEIFVSIGYDRVNQCFIAYNTSENIITTGVCVTSAIDEFKKQAQKKKLNVLEYGC